MSYVTYFPDQRHLLARTAIRRERLLPDGAIGAVDVGMADQVHLRDVVARGSVPSRYSILEAATYFNTRRPEAIESKLLVQMGDFVSVDDVVIGKANRRGKHMVSPVNGIVAYIGEGRIIIQEIPEQIEVQAGLEGRVVHVNTERGVVIETLGAVLQGVWGNGRFAIGQLRIEPPDGLETIYSDQIDIEYRGAVVVTRRPLKALSFDVIEDQEIGAVIAPSMDAGLIERALALPRPILLVQGFGDSRLNDYILRFLTGDNSLVGRQATVDAVLPDRFESRRPEVIINVPAQRGDRPPTPAVNLRLRVGMSVRLTRGPFAGMVGRVTDLPKMPQVLDNGLRVQCARIELPTGQTASVPLTNLEIFGQ